MAVSSLLRWLLWHFGPQTLYCSVSQVIVTLPVACGLMDAAFRPWHTHKPRRHIRVSSRTFLISWLIYISLTEMRLSHKSETPVTFWSQGSTTCPVVMMCGADVFSEAFQHQLLHFQWSIDLCITNQVLMQKPEVSSDQQSMKLKVTNSVWCWSIFKQM